MIGIINKSTNHFLKCISFFKNMYEMKNNATGVNTTGKYVK